jgi:hypothetical protein
MKGSFVKPGATKGSFIKPGATKGSFATPGTTKGSFTASGAVSAAEQVRQVRGRSRERLPERDAQYWARKARYAAR